MRSLVVRPLKAGGQSSIFHKNQSFPGWDIFGLAIVWAPVSPFARREIIIGVGFSSCFWALYCPGRSILPWILGFLVFSLRRNFWWI